MRTFPDRNDECRRMCTEMRSLNTTAMQCNDSDRCWIMMQVQAEDSFLQKNRPAEDASDEIALSEIKMFN